MKLAEQLYKSPFIRQNAVFFVGSLIVGILNYAYYPVIGRLLPLSDYGEVQILISLFAQLSLFLGVFNQVTVNIVATHHTKKQDVTFELEKLGIFLSIIIFIIAAISSKYIASFFRLSSTGPFIIMLLAFLITVPLTFRSAYLRGLRKFGQVSLVMIIGSGFEIALAAFFVLIGLGSAGAIAGLVFSQAIAYFYASHLVHKTGTMKPTGAKYFSALDWRLLRPELKYSLFVLILSLFTTIMPSIDTLAVKHYFNPTIAGLYAGVSIVARSVLYITGSLAGVLLPLLSGGKDEKLTTTNTRTLVKSLALLALIGGGALLIFSLFPRLIIEVLMGRKYLVFAHLLPKLSLAMFLFSIVNMLIIYFMALRQYWTSVIVLISTLSVGGLMLVRHGSVAMIVSNLVYSGLIILVLCGAWTLIGINRMKGSYAE